MEGNGKIFNRALVKMRRNRAASGWERYNFLKREASLRLADALDDIRRSFALALDLGCHKGEVAEALRSRVERVVGVDLSPLMRPHIVCDEEFLPFAEDSFDLVLSALALHHVNDLPGTLIQIRRILKPDGLFLAILPGAQSLRELRESIVGASVEHGFALSPRLSPLIEVRDAGALLQRAGFALPVATSDMVTVEYGDLLNLMQDLRGMGESNALLSQRKFFWPRTELAAVREYYRAHFSNDEGGVSANFEFITLTGWKPHSSQQNAAKRGSGKVNLNQVL